MGGCAKDSDTSPEPAGDGVVTFANAQITTRTNRDEWESGDEIGIYMTDCESSSDNRANVLYTTTDSAEGEFSVDSDFTPIYYPQSDTDKVTFYAYYPYSDAVGEDNLLDIDITLQNADEEDMGSVDFMVAKIENSTKTTAVEEFTFYHCLSMLVLKLSLNSEISSFDDMVTTIEGVNTKASFDVLSGDMSGSSATSDDITFTMAEDSGVMVASAILLPEKIAKNTVIKFTQGANSYTLTLSSDLTVEKGTKYIYSVVVGRDTVLTTGDSTIENWNDTTANDTPLYSQEED